MRGRRGEATFADYAATLIACADPDDALACHDAATHPKRHPGERLSAAVDRADLAFRAAAAHHCESAASGPFTGSLRRRSAQPIPDPRSAPTAAE